MPVATKIMPKTASVRDLQRKYKELFEYIKETHEPLYILTQNKPTAVLLAPDFFEEIVRDREMTEDEALDIARQGEEEYRTGKTKTLKSLADLD